MGAVTHSNLDDIFSYHKPKNDFQVEKYHGLRQAAKEASLVVLDTHEPEARATAIDKFQTYLEHHTGACRDQSEAFGLLEAARAFNGGAVRALQRVPEEAPPVEFQAEATAAIIQCIRAALMWANASVALECRI